MQVKELDGIHVIELAGRVDVTSSPELEILCNGLLDDRQYKIVCDFSHTEYVSSMGLRVFLSTLKRIRKVDGNLVLCCLKPGVMEIFDMTGLTSLFSVFDSTEAALDSFWIEPSQTHQAEREKNPSRIWRDPYREAAQRGDSRLHSHANTETDG